MRVNTKLAHAISVREQGDLSHSSTLFKQLVDSTNPSDPEYVRLMAEYVIQLRLEGQHLHAQALKLGRSLATTYPSDPAALQALALSLTDLGGYELALPLFKKMITYYPTNSLKRGEEQAHLANAFLRTSDLPQARSLIDQALINIQQNSANEPYTAVRESYAYLVLALINNASGQKEEAKLNAKRALDIAEKGHAPFRVAQAKEVLKLFSN